MIKKSLILIYILILGDIVCAQNTDRLTFVYKSVRVSFVIEENMFASNRYEPPANVQAIPIQNDLEIKECSALILKILQKYPDEVLAKYLKEVFILDEISLQDAAIGGTCSPKYNIVYITNNGYRNGYMEYAFHHEFSSIFLGRSQKKSMQKNGKKII